MRRHDLSQISIYIYLYSTCTFFEQKRAMGLLSLWVLRNHFLKEIGYEISKFINKKYTLIVPINCEIISKQSKFWQSIYRAIIGPIVWLPFMSPIVRIK